MRTLTALMTVIAGCQPAAQGPAVTTENAAPAAAESAPAVVEPTDRRGRAGIDRGEDAPEKAPVAAKAHAEGESPKRIPAAEFIVTTPPAKVPTIDGGARSPAATSALAWLTGTWRKAALQEEQDVYTALLHEDFKGHTTAQPGTIARDEWAKVRQPALGAKLSWGLEYVIANPNNTGRLTIRMTESLSEQAECTFSTRTLSLEPVADGEVKAWRVTSEERSKATPCPPTTTRDVIGAHTALGVAWRGQDLTAVQKALYGGFLLLDGGVESAQYNHAGLTAGAGRWVLEEVAKTVATPENTQLIGDTAVVRTASGARLGYRIGAGTWRLTTLWRDTKAGL